MFPQITPTMNRIVETPAARATDPETSHLAAAEITRSGVRGHQQSQVVAAVRAFPGCTSFELAMKTSLDRYVVARRLSECVTSGDVKKGDAKACPVTGRLALSWWPVEARE